MMKSGVYKLYWLNNPKFYIGSSKHIFQREYSHIISLKNNRHGNRLMQEVYNVYGEPLISVLETCDLLSLRERENFYIKSLFNKDCLNINSIGRVTVLLNMDEAIVHQIDQFMIDNNIISRSNAIEVLVKRGLKTSTVTLK